jgi:hypothetical protein
MSQIGSPTGGSTQNHKKAEMREPTEAGRCFGYNMHDDQNKTKSLRFEGGLWNETYKNKDICFAEFKAIASAFNDNETTMQDEDEMRDNGALQAGSKSFTYEGIKREVQLFLEDALSTSRKHFTTVWTGPLIHFAIAGEKDTSVPFCKWLCDGTTEGLGTVFSEVH